MKKVELLITCLTPQVSALYHFVGDITVSLVLGIPVVFLFGGALLPLLGHGLHLQFEVFESIA